MKKTFNKISEIDSAPIPLSGVEVFDRVKNISRMYGKTQKKDGTPNNIWKKRFIFFDLPYWCDLHVRPQNLSTIRRKELKIIYCLCISGPSLNYHVKYIK